MQCSDNPGVNAYHVEGRGWVLSGDELNAVEFRGQHCNIRWCHRALMSPNICVHRHHISPIRQCCLHDCHSLLDPTKDLSCTAACQSYSAT